MTNTSELSRKLRKDADVWAEAVHTIAGPATAALLRESADTIDRLTSTGEAVLPCDVQLPPATVLRKGVKLSTLHEALRIRGMHASQREGHVEVPVEPSDDPTPMECWTRARECIVYGIDRASRDWRDPSAQDAARRMAEELLETFDHYLPAHLFAALPHNQGETKP